MILELKDLNNEIYGKLLKVRKPCKKMICNDTWPYLLVFTIKIYWLSALDESIQLKYEFDCSCLCFISKFNNKIYEIKNEIKRVAQHFSNGNAILGYKVYPDCGDIFLGIVVKKTFTINGDFFGLIEEQSIDEDGSNSTLFILKNWSENCCAGSLIGLGIFPIYIF